MSTDTDTRWREIQSYRRWHNTFVLISCVLPMIVCGYSYAIGTLFTDVMTAFNSTRAETSVIQSTTMGVFLFSGLFTGVFVKKTGMMFGGMFGCLLLSLALMACFFASSTTYLIIFVGVLSGIGKSCVYISSASTVSKKFSGKKQLLYMSVHASGIGIGGMIYPYIIRSLSDLYGFRGALLIVGAVALNALPGCILWKQQSNKNKGPGQNAYITQIEEFQTKLQVITMNNGNSITIQKIGEHHSTVESDNLYVSQYPVLQDKMKTSVVTVQNAVNNNATTSNKAAQTPIENIKNIMHNKVFILFVSGLIFVTPTLMMVVFFIADIYKDKSLSNDDVSLGILLINTMSVIGRLLAGVLLQYKYIPTLILPSLNSLVAAAVILLLTFVKARWLIIVLTSVNGIAIGMFNSMYSVVSLKLVGINLLPITMGIILTSISIGQWVTGPINGYIRDVTGSYTTTFYLAAGINLIGAAVFFTAYIKGRKGKQTIKRQSSVFYLTSF